MRISLQGRRVALGERSFHAIEQKSTPRIPIIGPGELGHIYIDERDGGFYAVRPGIVMGTPIFDA